MQSSLLSGQKLFTTSSFSKEPHGRRRQNFVRALFGKKNAVADKNAKNKNSKQSTERKQNGLSSIIEALDFSQVRSDSDAKLLYDAKYGQRKDGRMSKEQYQALRRKVGGTSKDYFKEWVDVQGKYAEKGYVSTEASTVTGLPFLLAVVLALFGALGYVVSQTS